MLEWSLLNTVEAAALLLVCVFAVLAIELPDLLHAILALAGLSIGIAVLFWLLGAPYVAVFQLIVYGGAVIVLFVAAVMLTARRSSQ